MKRQQSIDKSKPNLNLAQQLKARLYDKGTISTIQVSATGRYHQSKDKSKITTIMPNPSKIQP